jgi:hypothetical protein
MWSAARSGLHPDASWPPCADGDAMACGEPFVRGRATPGAANYKANKELRASLRPYWRRCGAVTTSTSLRLSEVAHAVYGCHVWLDTNGRYRSKRTQSGHAYFEASSPRNSNGLAETMDFRSIARHRVMLRAAEPTAQGSRFHFAECAREVKGLDSR